MLAHFCLIKLLKYTKKGCQKLSRGSKSLLLLLPTEKSLRVEIPLLFRFGAWSSWNCCRRWNFLSLSLANVPANCDSSSSSSMYVSLFLTALVILYKPSHLNASFWDFSFSLLILCNKIISLKASSSYQIPRFLLWHSFLSSRLR